VQFCSSSEPAATNATLQDEAVQAVLGMNPNTSSPPSPGIFIFLFPCPGSFQPSYLPPKFSPPTLKPKANPTLNLNSFSPLHSKHPWNAQAVERCGALELWGACGALKLWSLKTTFTGKVNTHVLFFHGFHGFFEYELTIIPTGWSFVFSHVFFSLLIIVPLKTKRR